MPSSIWGVVDGGFLDPIYLWDYILALRRKDVVQKTQKSGGLISREILTIKTSPDEDWEDLKD
jgi:hypothetical protein